MLFSTLVVETGLNSFTVSENGCHTLFTDLSDLNLIGPDNPRESNSLVSESYCCFIPSDDSTENVVFICLNFGQNRC